MEKVTDTDLWLLVPAGATSGDLTITKGGVTKTAGAFAVFQLDNTKKNYPIQYGHSLVYGQGATNLATDTTFAQLHAKLDPALWANGGYVGHPGATLSTLLTVGTSPDGSDDGTMGYTVLNGTNAENWRQVVISLDGTINSITQGVSWPAIKAQLKQQVANLRRYELVHGSPFRIILETPTYSGGNPFGYGTLAAYMAAVDVVRNGMVADWKEIGADYCCNYNSDPRLIDTTNATYFRQESIPQGYFDRQHNTTAGYAVRAELLLPYFIAAINMTALDPKPDYVP
ncbi:MAG: hypothetical protein EOO60_11530 [Hymenobacter sp.]|nr:MAG: hypothetical protein EOO60_11530 [Hymenobacter sp.]